MKLCKAYRSFFRPIILPNFHLAHCFCTLFLLRSRQNRLIVQELISKALISNHIFQQKCLASVITVKLASKGFGNIPTVQIFIYRRICTVFEGVNNQQGFIIILSQNSLIACWVVIIPCGAFNNCCFASISFP